MQHYDQSTIPRRLDGSNLTSTQVRSQHRKKATYASKHYLQKDKGGSRPTLKN